MSEGSATITVEGGGESDTIEIVVFAASSPGIFFNLGNSLTVQAGDELVIDNVGDTNAFPPVFPFVQTTPGRELEFTSSDASVVTVDATGLLVAHAPGEALITVTISEDPGASATMRLKVLEAGSIDVFELEPATGLIQLPFFPEDQAPIILQLNVEQNGERITDFLPRFASSDETVAVVLPRKDIEVSALVIGIAPGTATITAETGGLTAESVITVE
jgi:uncharacterized protein YjdB